MIVQQVVEGDDYAADGEEQTVVERIDRGLAEHTVDQKIDVTVFGTVDDVEAMVDIGTRVRRQGVEKITISRG